MFNISDESAQEIINSFKIPPKPQVLVQLQQEQAKEDSSLAAFAEIISQDVAMSAAILKTINSPSFGFNRAITDIKQSVIMLGAKFVTTFATQFQLKAMLKSNSAISHEKFWDTATETANMMKILLEHLDLKSACPIEDAYSAGLFRDCGIPLMALKYNDYKEVLMEANKTPERTFTDIEESHYPTNHAVVGYFLASSWHFPKPLAELILRHHEPDFLTATDTSAAQKDLYALVKIAGKVLNQYKFSKDDSEWLLAKDPVLAHFGLSDLDFSDLEEDVKEAYRDLFS